MKIETTADLEPLKYWNYLRRTKDHYDHIIGATDCLCELLETPLTLDLFIPAIKVDDGWVVLDKPSHLQEMQAGWIDNPMDNNFYKVQEYRKAEKKVLFQLCESELIAPKSKEPYFVIRCKDEVMWVSWNKSKTIQDLIPLSIPVTQNLINKL